MSFTPRALRDLDGRFIRLEVHIEQRRRVRPEIWEVRQEPRTAAPITSSSTMRYGSDGSSDSLATRCHDRRGNSGDSLLSRKDVYPAHCSLADIKIAEQIVATPLSPRVNKSRKQIEQEIAEALQPRATKE